MISLEPCVNYVAVEATVNMVKEEAFVQNATVHRYVNTKLREEDVFHVTGLISVHINVLNRDARNAKEMEYVATISKKLRVKYVIQRVI